MPLVMEVGLGPGHIVVDGDPAAPTERGTAAPTHFSGHVCCGQTAAHLSYCYALVSLGLVFLRLFRFSILCVFLVIA